MEEGERKNPGVAREYRSEEIVVSWEPEYCIHTANCLMGLPQGIRCRSTSLGFDRRRLCRRDRAGGHAMSHRSPAFSAT